MFFNYLCKNLIMSITKIISEYLEKKGVSQTALGEKMGKNRQYINGLLTKNKDLNSHIIKSISIALEYDFFAELSKELRKEHKEIKSSLNKETNTSEFEDAMIEVLKKRFPNIFR